MKQKKEDNGEAIAKCIYEMANLTVPVIAIVIGEGSSGGALAIGVGNSVIMLENAIYSILSPEGYASIVWKDGSKVKEAATEMKLTAKDLYDLHVIDKIIKENNKIFENLRNEIILRTQETKDKTGEEIRNERYEKFRQMGEYKEIERENENDIKK